MRAVLIALALLLGVDVHAQQMISSGGAPPLTKGTPGSVGWTTQDLKDANRVNVVIYAQRVTPILTTPTVITFNEQIGDGVVNSAITTHAFNISTKRFRVQYLHISATPTSTTAAVIQFQMRTSVAGPTTCTSTSVAIGSWEIGTPPGTIAANVGNYHVDVMFPDGYEFGNGAQRSMCFTANALGAASQALTFTLIGYEY